MHRIITITATLIALLAVGSAFGQGNILANVDIEVAASVTPTTNSATIGVYDSVKGQQWGLVYGIGIQNNADVTVVTTAAAVDLGASTAVGTATTNATDTASLINLVSAPIPAREVTIMVVTPSNDTAFVNSYWIYAK